jgi:hypothetical protein
MTLSTSKGKGKKVNDAHKEKPSKKSKLTKGGSSSRVGGSSNVTQPQGPSPPILYTVGTSLKLPPMAQPMSFKFFNEAARERYVFLQETSLHPERAFSSELLEKVPEIKEQLVDRGWEKFNDILSRGQNDKGRSLNILKEFLAHAYVGLPCQAKDTSYVRGRIINYSPAAINAFLETKVVKRCAFRPLQDEVDHWNVQQRREVKEYLSLPGTPWLAAGGKNKPSKFKATHLLATPRVWFEFFINNIYSVGNNSEAQVEAAAGVKVIMEGKPFNLGLAISTSIDNIATNLRKPLSVGHCNFINALCKHQGVLEPTPLEDTFVFPKWPLRFKDWEKYGELPKEYKPPREGEDIAEEAARIDQVDGGEQPELNQSPTQQQNNQPPSQAPDVATSSHSASELAILSHLMDLSQEAGLRSCYIDTQSSLYTEAMGIRASTPPILYAHLYPTQDAWNTHLQEEQVFFLARQEQRTCRWKAEMAALERERVAREEEETRRREHAERMMFDIEAYPNEFDFIPPGPSEGV